MNAPHRLLTSPERMRLTVEHFLLLNDSGAFADYGRTELIDGDIYVMNAQHLPHAQALSRLLVMFAVKLAGIGSDLEAVAEVSVRLNGDTVPEPDIVLTNWRGTGIVPIETVALVVEVAATTLDIDLGRKAELYASAGVPEYWVVDVEGRRVVIHHDPVYGRYARQQEVAFGQPLAATTMPDLDLGVVRFPGLTAHPCTPLPRSQ